jgi:hypothetical protein
LLSLDATVAGKKNVNCAEVSLGGPQARSWPLLLPSIASATPATSLHDAPCGITLITGSPLVMKLAPANITVALVPAMTTSGANEMIVGGG